MGRLRRTLNAANTSTVFIRPFPPTAKYRVDTGFWAPDSKTLYYVPTAGRNSFFAVTVTTRPSFEISKSPATVTRPQPVGGGPKLPRQYDVSPDGEHFIIALADESSSNPFQAQIRIVLNWSEELKQRVPTR